MRRSGETACAGAAALVMAAVGFWDIRRPPLWLDEGVTYAVGHLRVRDILRTLGNVDAVHGAYYLLMHALFTIFGGEILTMRVPSALALVGTAALTAVLGAGLTGSALVGLAASFLLAASPFVSYNAQNGRSYALVCLVVAASTLQLARILGTPAREAVESARNWVGYGALMVAAVYLHELSALAFVAHGVTVFAVRRPFATRRAWLITAVTGAVIALPLVAVSLGQSDQLPNRTGGVAARFLRLWQTYTSTNTVVAVVVAVCVVAALIPGRRPQRPDTANLVTVAGPLLLVPSLVLGVVAAFDPNLYSTQYLFYVMPALGLLAAAGAWRLAGLVTSPAGPASASRGPRLVAAALPVVLAAAVFLVQLPALRHERSPSGRFTDLTSAAAYFGAHRQRGDGVVFVPATFRSTRLAYPHDFTGTVDVALRESPQRAHNLRGVYRSLPGITARMLAHRRIWLVGRIQALDRPEFQDQMDLQLRVLHRCFRLNTLHRWYGVEDILYIRRANAGGCAGG